MELSSRVGPGGPERAPPADTRRNLRDQARRPDRRRALARPPSRRSVPTSRSGTATAPTAPRCCPRSPTSTRCSCAAPRRSTPRRSPRRTKLKVVARAGVGLDNVDVKAATQAGVMVVNAPTSNIVSAAELAVGPAARQRAQHPAGRRGAEERRSGSARSTPASRSPARPSASSASAASASLVAQRLRAFGVTLIAYDPYVQPARAAQIGVRLVSLDELLARVRLHHRPPAQDRPRPSA